MAVQGEGGCQDGDQGGLICVQITLMHGERAAGEGLRPARNSEAPKNTEHDAAAEPAEQKRH